MTGTAVATPVLPDLVSIAPADPARRDLAALFARAFAGDAHIDWLLPARGDREGARLALFSILLDGLGGQLQATPDHQAAALWFAPGGGLDWRAQARFFRFLAASLGPLAALSRGLDLKRMDGRHPNRPHYYLQLLAVAPENRGRGLGRTLAGAMLEQARRDDCPAYLETSSPANVAFYRGLGFAVSAETRLAGGLTLWSLVWNPGRAPL